MEAADLARVLDTSDGYVIGSQFTGDLRLLHCAG